MIDAFGEGSELGSAKVLGEHKDLIFGHYHPIRVECANDHGWVHF